MLWLVPCFRMGYGSRPKGQVTLREDVVAAARRFLWKRLPDGCSRPSGEKPSGRNPTGDASDVARLFFPHSQVLGIRPDDTVSPAVLRKMVYAGSHASSFEQASEDLKEEAELDISAQRVMRATKRIGQERVAERKAWEAAWEALPLPEQQGSPHEQVPQVACVEPDGGRIQIRKGAFLAGDESGLPVVDDERNVRGRPLPDDPGDFCRSASNAADFAGNQGFFSSRRFADEGGIRRNSRA